MLTVTAICDQYAFLYSSLPTPEGTWDHIVPVDGAYAAIKRVNGIDYVMFRGSTTFLDWVEDFKNCAFMHPDPILGLVHPGACEGVTMVKDQIDALVGDHVVIVGHSLGAMHAAIFAGYRAAAGKKVEHLVMFGEPRPGGPKLSYILRDIPVQSFRNANSEGHDAVTDVPYRIMPDLPYQHVRTLTDCRHDPSPLDVWGPFRFHHFGHYARAFGCGAPQALSLQA